MPKFRKKPVVIEAEQWFKNMDHSMDIDPVVLNGEHVRQLHDNKEGYLVRYFRNPDVPGEKSCIHCNKPMHVHGWVDTLEAGHRVCPEDWIIRGVKGEYYPCKPDVFEKTYDRVEEIPTSNR